MVRAMERKRFIGDQCAAENKGGAEMKRLWCKEKCQYLGYALPDDPVCRYGYQLHGSHYESDLVWLDEAWDGKETRPYHEPETLCPCMRRDTVTQ